jgi:hypothetical protein
MDSVPPSEDVIAPSDPTAQSLDTGDGPEGARAESLLSTAALMGALSPKEEAELIAIPAPLGSRAGLKGRREAVESLTRMAQAAKADGIELRVLSAFRSFEDQRRIWEDKWTGVTRVEGGRLPETVPDPERRALKILEYSSMPGTSRHHWGTEFDLNSLESRFFLSGEGRGIHEWLTAHGPQFGFCQVYSPKGPDRPNGYNTEEWHWSYMPLSSRFLSDYLSKVTPETIQGFKGSETARGIDVIGRYVQGVNPACARLASPTL